MSIQYTITTPEDFAEMDLGSDELRDLTQHSEALTAAKRDGGVVTALWSGKILYVAGHYPVHPGVQEVFVIPSTHVKAHPLVFHRHINTWLHQIMTGELGVHRWQTASLSSPDRDRWMKSLGFVCEGTMRQYTSDGQDWKMWSIVNGIRG